MSRPERRDFRARLLARAQPEPNSGCWLWDGPLDAYGYGVFQMTRTEAHARGRTGRGIKAHRVSWAVHHGEIPAGLLVLHHCDNRACVNPEHLYVGTDADNVRDMLARGRHKPAGVTGEEHPRAVLTEDDVIAIRSILRGNRVSQQEVADMFGVHQTQISRIVLRKQWRNRAEQVAA